MEAADWEGLFKLPTEVSTKSTEVSVQLPGLHSFELLDSSVISVHGRLLPDDLVALDLSPQGAAAISGTMDPRFLLQLQSCWMLCPEFKLMFWEVGLGGGWEQCWWGRMGCWGRRCVGRGV